MSHPRTYPGNDGERPSENSGRQICTLLFQPVVNLSDLSILGFEIILEAGDHSGPQGSRWDSVKAYGNAALSAISAFSRELRKSRYFLPISTEAMTDPHFADLLSPETLQDYGLDSSQILLQLVEPGPEERRDLERTLRRCVEQGFNVAMDEVGAEESTMRGVLSISPHFVLVDRDIIRGLDTDVGKRRFLTAITDISHRADCKPIASGVASFEEMEVLLDMGLRLAWGDLWGMAERTTSELGAYPAWWR
ncbi:EAL domain-containing protein [Candidatus Fermentibacteria bacterium]|nr:EAL domain-containing protein [Candidatus Fermentibacteria bacterium]